ncbi:MAG: hypothetical protein AAF708_09735 [Deinococcota bacterium]
MTVYEWLNTAHYNSLLTTADIDLATQAWQVSRQIFCEELAAALDTRSKNKSKDISKTFHDVANLVRALKP